MSFPDTRLAVYQGSAVGALSLVARNDDQHLGEPRSFCEFDASAGQHYRIQVGDAPGSSNQVVLLRWYANPPVPYQVPGACGDATSFISNPSLETDLAAWDLTDTSADAADVLQRILGDAAKGAACIEVASSGQAGAGLIYVDPTPRSFAGPTTMTVWLKIAGGTPPTLVLRAKAGATRLVPTAGGPDYTASPTGDWQAFSFTYAALPVVTGVFSLSIEAAAASDAFVLRADCLNASTTALPPGPPSGLACAPSSTQIRLTWAPSAGADGYYVRVNETLVATISGTEILITGLVPGTSYALKVSAFDSAGESTATQVTCSTVTTNSATPPEGACGAIGFLELNGREVANTARTVEYLKAGLVDGWSVPNDPCGILLREIGSVPATPAIDPAPWWDPARPESGDFLGALLSMKLVPATTRSVNQRASGLGGATFGPQTAAATELQATGTLIARSSGGMAYGRRWLENILRATDCDPCGLGIARIRLACPPADASDDTLGEYLLYDVALAAAPKDNEAGRDWQDVEFTLTAGNPFLYHRTALCASGTLNLDPGHCVPFSDWFCGPLDGSFASSIACAIQSPSLFGVNATIITISADIIDATGIEIDVYAAGTPCPPPAATPPVASLAIPHLPAGSVLVIDSAREVLAWYPSIADANAGTNAQSGTPYIQLPDGVGMTWVAAEPCAPAACVVVGKRNLCGGSAAIRIDTQIREA